MAVELAWVGAAESTGAWVRAKVTGASVRIAVSPSADLSDPTFHGPATPTSDGVASVRLTGLSPSTRYWWEIEEDSVVTDATGQFRTHPPVGQPASFIFGVGGDTGLDLIGEPTEFITDAVSNRPVLDTVRTRAVAEDWLFFAHIGDLHYRNIGSDDHPLHDEAAYRQAFDDVATYNGTEGLDARMGRLMRDIPWVYVWDDHDFGPNNATRNAPGREAALAVYGERVPHYPLGLGGGQNPIDQAFRIGRIQFLVSDTRSQRVDDDHVHSGAQLAWYESILAASSAELLVWLYPNPWNSANAERVEIAAMLDRTGWSDRMVMISADMHALAIDNGANHPVEDASWPRMCFAALDAASAGGSGAWTFGPDGGRDRYGTVRVVDTGSQISVTAAGWVSGSLWQSFSFTVSTDTEPGPGPGPGVPPVAEAVIRTRVTWLGCDLVTGRIIAELPDITGPASRVLGAHTSAGLRLPIPLGGPGALGPRAIQATQPGRTMVVAVVNDIPTWGGIVINRRGGTAATLDLGTVSLEGYLDRRYVQDHVWTQQDEASVIAAGLLADAQVEGIGFLVDAPATGTLRDREYKTTDDATVYRRLQELMAVEGGPEWTVDLDWMDSGQTVVAKVVRVRKRIGRPAAQPNAVFEIAAGSVFSSRGASDARYSYGEDFSAGKGANHVLATSSGEGDDRPTSEPARAEDLLDAGWPRYEERITPSTSIKDIGVLNAHARAERDLRRLGAKTWQITARWDATPRYGIDWRIGDDVAWVLTGHRHPDGTIGQGRVIGFDLDMQGGTIQPILWEPGS